MAPCGAELRVLVCDKQDVTWPWALATQKIKYLLGSSQQGGQQRREGVIPLCSALLLCSSEHRHGAGRAGPGEATKMVQGDPWSLLWRKAALWDLSTPPSALLQPLLPLLRVRAWGSLVSLPPLPALPQPHLAWPGVLSPTVAVMPIPALQQAKPPMNPLINMEMENVCASLAGSSSHAKGWDTQTSHIPPLQLQEGSPGCLSVPRTANRASAFGSRLADLPGSPFPRG